LLLNDFIILKKILFILLILPCIIKNINAQNIDSVRVVRDTLKKETPSVSQLRKDSVFIPNPKKALLYSIIPGGGQIYNRKALYIRLPLIYGAMGGTIYYTSWSSKQYQRFKSAYEKKVRNETLPSDIPTSISADYLKRLRDNYFKRTQQAYALVGAAYLLSAAEAFTTAHLLNFDVNDDLSLRIKPDFQNMPYGTASGVGISLTF
jgi:hypothetical protein